MTKKKPKHLHKKDGRPTSMTPETVKKLEDAFSQGFNVSHACGMAEISRETYYSYLKINPKFADKVEWLRSKPYIKSVLQINKAINQGDLPTCRWYAERKGKNEFSLRNEITGEDGEPIKMQMPVINVVFTDEKK